MYHLARESCVDAERMMNEHSRDESKLYLDIHTGFKKYIGAIAFCGAAFLAAGYAANHGWIEKNLAGKIRTTSFVAGAMSAAALAQKRHDADLSTEKDIAHSGYLAQAEKLRRSSELRRTLEQELDKRNDTQ